MPGLMDDHPDMVEPAYILFEDEGSGEFAFGCCTGQIWEASSTRATSISFSWSGCDEMEQVEGDGFALFGSGRSVVAHAGGKHQSCGRYNERKKVLGIGHSRVRV